MRSGRRIRERQDDAFANFGEERIEAAADTAGPEPVERCVQAAMLTIVVAARQSLEDELGVPLALTAETLGLEGGIEAETLALGRQRPSLIVGRWLEPA